MDPQTVAMMNRVYRSVYADHYKAVIRDAKYVIRRALAEHPGPMAVAVSGGKDSVAMAHLVAEFCHPFILWNDSGLELPESGNVVQALAEKLGCELIIAKGDGMEIKLAKERGEKGAARKDTAREALVLPTIRALHAHGIVLEFVGLRSNESQGRRDIIKRYGPVHDNKGWQVVTAWPMRNWHSEDCLAYIDEFGLPLHPAYLRGDPDKRASIRVSWVWDSLRDNDGGLEYIRRWYPDIFRRLREAGVQGI
jgi:3'-phosphoadenosine 5'-phosphosulfate sulfotransferase (PAPS reductase)/FAD synthetase